VTNMEWMFEGDTNRYHRDLPSVFNNDISLSLCMGSMRKWKRSSTEDICIFFI